MAIVFTYLAAICVLGAILSGYHPAPMLGAAGVCLTQAILFGLLVALLGHVQANERNSRRTLELVKRMRRRRPAAPAAGAPVPDDAEALASLKLEPEPTGDRGRPRRRRRG